MSDLAAGFSYEDHIRNWLNEKPVLEQQKLLDARLWSAAEVLIEYVSAEAAIELADTPGWRELVACLAISEQRQLALMAEIESRAAVRSAAERRNLA